jgi:hypothetical protein
MKEEQKRTEGREEKQRAKKTSAAPFISVIFCSISC